MKKKEKMPVRRRRLMAIVFAAALIIETVLIYPAGIVIADASETAAGAELQGHGGEGSRENSAGSTNGAARTDQSISSAENGSTAASTDFKEGTASGAPSSNAGDAADDEKTPCAHPADVAGAKKPADDAGDAAGTKEPADDAGDAAGTKESAVDAAEAAGTKDPADDAATAAGTKEPADDAAEAAGTKDPANDAADAAGTKETSADSPDAAGMKNSDPDLTEQAAEGKTAGKESIGQSAEKLFRKLFRAGKKQSTATDAGGADADADGHEGEVSGRITVKEDGAAVYAGEGTIFYNKAVSLVFTCDREGSYTVSYLKNGKRIKKETALREPCTFVLEDDGAEQKEHSVYSGFTIEGEDEDGNEVTVSEKPDKKIVIDSRGPAIDSRLERSSKGLFFYHGEEAECTVTADDGNGAGADPEQYSYYIGEASETDDSLRKLPESKWKSIQPDKGKYVFKLINLSGEIYLRVKDRLGNTSYKSAGPLVHEQVSPVIRVKISDPDQKEIYACSSGQSEEERQKDISEYYRTLHVQVSVSEQPPRAAEQGYSGISRVLWALVPSGTERQTAEKSREELLCNQSPSDRKELYEEERYRTWTGSIDPDKLVEKLAAGAAGYEESGSYDFYIWAVDFCGNGEEDPVRIPVLLDARAPEVTVSMENGTEYEGDYFYRADNDMDPSNDQDTPAVTIRAADDRKEGGVRGLTAVLKGNVTQEELVKKASGSDGDSIVFTVEDLKKHFGDTEEEIAVTVEAQDTAGNKTTWISEKGSSGVRCVKDQNGRAASARFIRDAIAPVITITYASGEQKAFHIYGREGEGDSAGFTAYTCGNASVTYEMKEAYPGEDRLFRSVRGLMEQDMNLPGGSSVPLALTAAEGEEKSFCCSAYGTDIAGNSAIVKEQFAQDTETIRHPGNLSVEDVYTQTDCGAKGGHKPCFLIFTDRKAPEITLSYSVERDRDPGPTAYIYDDHCGAGNVLTAYISGAVHVRAVLEEDGENIDFGRLFIKNPGQEAVSWEQSGISFVTEGQNERHPCIELETAGRDGEYLYCAFGTDRAGNRANVTERFGEGSVLQKMYTDEKELFGKREAAGEEYVPYYTLVIDTAAPVYRLTINNPTGLEETFDRKKGIAYYGKSISSIRAQYVVTEENFDENRILAGIAGKSLSGAERMESLSPDWTAPDGKGKTAEKDGTVSAVFSLQVDVDRQYEGMYRFEIEGCDRAGNVLAPSAEQRESDESDSLFGLAAKTVAHDAAKGSFWTQRKAVDVTAPSGFLKVRSPRSGEVYYEMGFSAGGNNSLKYEPFRRETSAIVTVGSKDCSATRVSFGLRSLDAGTDASLKEKDPLISAGRDGYGSSNVLKTTLEGEQVFYLENILVKDRAGNVCTADPKAACTLVKSGNIYLDVTEPDVSEIRDAESPRIRIEAGGSFTRHEADSGRYIYRPDGAFLDLEVSVADPGGRARSSGLQEVTAEVRAGDRLVTDQVTLSDIPYHYKEGEGTALNPLKYEILNARISIPTGSFAESNDITIIVRARDNCGNESVPARDGGLLKLGIDTTAPAVEVVYHDTAEPKNGRYFKADRIADIIVTDRNVENSSIKIETNTAVPSFFTAPHANKESDGGGENGNGDRWVKTLRYDKDGDYTLQISGTDALGNRISEIKWTGPAPQAFTVDKTKPLIRITLPEAVNTKDGVKYYDRAVSASIEILEHNFGGSTWGSSPDSASDNTLSGSSDGTSGSFSEEAGRGLLDLDIRTSGHSGDAAPALPSRSAFRRAASDLYRAAVLCREDGDYEITASFTDLAGNEALAEGGEGRKSAGEAWSGRFTVDTAAPQLVLDPATFRVDPSSGKPVEGLERQVYRDRDFAPRVMIRDTNYDEEHSDLVVTRYGRKETLKEMTRKDGDAEKGEYSIQLRQFGMVRESDGVYKALAQARDLAGHETILEFIFSINRFGSSYVYADDPTERKMADYYINDTKEALKILELSPIELKTHAAEVFKDHQRKKLEEGREYTFEMLESPEAVRPAEAVEEKPGTLGGVNAGNVNAGRKTAETEPAAEDKGACFAYVYTILPQVFEEEGVYDFILSSTDIAGSQNSTVLLRDGRVQGDEILQVKFPIELQVDKTVPVNRIVGVKEEQEVFDTDRLAFTICPEDYQTDIKKVEVRIRQGGRSGKDTGAEEEEYRLYRQIDRKEDAAQLARQHIYPIEEVWKGIPIVLEGRGNWQYLEVIATDLAGNESIDCREGDPDRELPDTRRRFLVSANPLIGFYSCGPLFWGMIAGAVCFPGIFLFRRRRQEKSKDNGTA